MREDKKKVAVVTGASSGIGLSVAKALARQNYALALTSSNANRLFEAASAIREETGAVVFEYAMDIRKKEEVCRFVRLVIDTYSRIDVLVSNAGVAKRVRVADTDECDWDWMLDTNLKGTFLICKECLPYLRQNKGYIITMASRSGKVGRAYNGAYGASKFGMIGLTESILKEEMEYGVRATTLCPGLVDTSLITQLELRAKAIPPEDIASTVVWLLSLSTHTVVKEVSVVSAHTIHPNE